MTEPTKQLRPWQALPSVTCEGCEEQATWRVFTVARDPNALDLSTDPPTLYVGGGEPQPQVMAGLVCERHMRSFMEHVTRTTGLGCEGCVIRLSWAVWFRTQCVVTRWWLWPLWNRWFDWRWQRGKDGKRFGYEIVTRRYEIR